MGLSLAGTLFDAVKMWVHGTSVMGEGGAEAGGGLEDDNDVADGGFAFDVAEYIEANANVGATGLQWQNEKCCLHNTPTC